MMFRKKYPNAWTYHRYTCRWPFNMHGLNAPNYEIPPFKENLEANTIDLPPPILPETPLRDTIHARHCCRHFRTDTISLNQLSTLLYAGYGIHGVGEFDGEFLERPVPSGGGLYPLELYVLAQRLSGVDGGVYHYVPLGHRLELVHDTSLPQHMTSEMFLGQPYLVQAAVLIVMTAMLERSLWKYEDRGYRYILLEAGHVGQNLNLTAAAMGLGSLNLGGFFDQDLGALLRVDEGQEIPLYGIAVGVPEKLDRTSLRKPSEEDALFRRY
jgi:SagB-type dehydrogenase family enzyme